MDHNANHVIQRCLEIFRLEKVEFIVHILNENVKFINVSQNNYFKIHMDAE